MIADWLTSAGFGAVKPVAAALLLPPVPMLALALAGLGVMRARPRTGRWLVLAALAGVWLGSSIGAARCVQESWLAPPAPLDAAQRARLQARATAGARIAIVVLGGGMNADAPEYEHRPDPAAASLQRLRYGVWLGRQTGIPVAVTGGLGWAQADGAAMAEGTRMAEIARDEFELPLRWVEATSRDTHENAVNTLALLQPAGIDEIVLVTNGTHMPRALREFRAAAPAGVRITPATMGEAWPADSALLRWLPSGEGLLRMRAALREVLAGMIDRR
jgi:uncharacterized SAM-binding protein YcdF (DUF218 family)